MIINFQESPTNTPEKFLRITNEHATKKFAIFISATRSQCLTAPPTISRMEMVTHSMHFQRQNDSKISTLIKGCWSLSVKNCHAKGMELTPMMYICGELIVGHEKCPQFAQCFNDKTGHLSDNLLDLRLKGTVLDSSARKFWRKTFSWEQIFASWCLIVKIAKTSALRKFPTIR